VNPPSAPSPSASTRLWTRRAWISSTLAGLAAAGLLSSGCSRLWRGGLPVGSAGRIRVLAWSEYFKDVDEVPDANGILVPTVRKEEVVAAFENETGIAVDVELFDSNEQLAKLLLAEGANYDLALVPGFAAKRLQGAGWLHKIPSKLVPNAKYVDWKRFKFGFDREREFAIPYVWGSTGIAYNISYVPRLPNRWSDLFTDLQDVAGEPLRVALLDDGRFSLGVALIALGHHPHTEDLAEIEAAGKLLASLSNRSVMLKTNQLVKGLEEESIHLALATSGDVTKAMRRNKNVRLALPPEGSLLFRDTFVMPLTPVEKRRVDAGGRPELTTRRENALQFLDYMLRPEVAGQVSNFSCYATTLPAARAYVDRWITNGAAYFINPAGKDIYLEELESAAPNFEKVWPQVRRLWA